MHGLVITCFSLDDSFNIHTKGILFSSPIINAARIGIMQNSMFLMRKRYAEGKSNAVQ